MLKTSVIRHFGDQAQTARALGITIGAVSQWPKVIPRGSAYQVEVVTGGKLRVDPRMYPPKKRPDLLRTDEVA